MEKSLEGRIYGEGLRPFVLFSLTKRKLRDDPMAVYSFLRGRGGRGSRRGNTYFLSVLTKDRT